MKKVHVKNKLALDKEAISRLNNDEMNLIKGGVITIVPYTTLCARTITAEVCCDIETLASCAC